MVLPAFMPDADSVPSQSGSMLWRWLYWTSCVVLTREMHVSVFRQSKKVMLGLCAPVALLLHSCWEWISILARNKEHCSPDISLHLDQACGLWQFIWGHAGRWKGLQEHLFLIIYGTSWNASAWHSWRSWWEIQSRSHLTNSACFGSFSTWSSTHTTLQRTPEMPTLTKGPSSWIWRTSTSRDCPSR